LRFNTDIGRLEVWRNDHWATILGESPNVGVSTFAAGISAAGTGSRGLTGGGYITTKQDVIDYWTIPTLGNSVDFGNLSEQRYWIASCSSTTRGIWGGGGVSPTSPNKTDRIDFVTISSTGDATDFGNLVQARYGLASCSNRTRGLFSGGYQAPGSQVDHIDYITIASSGVHAQDFGNLSFARYYLSSLSSSTRGVILSGRTGTSPYTYYNAIDYVTIASTGNANDFGDLLVRGSEGYTAANSTRGIYFSGYDNGSGVSNIDYITTASTGNAQDFGDMVGNVIVASSATADSTRGVTSGGYQPGTSSITNRMTYVTIATTGNTIDFGDQSDARYVTGSCSNGHGGL